MQKTSLHYIGSVTIKSIKDFILDKTLTDRDTILLNRVNYDQIVLEYRTTYNESITVPYFLLQILVKEDNTNKVPVNRIGLIVDDTSRSDNDFEQFTNGTSVNTIDENYSDEIIYRCGYCGNIVDFDGSEYDNQTRQFKIKILEKFRSTVTVKNVAGKCCPNGNNR